MASRPETIVEFVAFDPPSEPSPTWYDISEFNRGTRVSRGRGSELERFDAGTLSITLDNTDRRFDSTYEGYEGNLVPNPSFEVANATGWTLGDSTFTPDSSGPVNDWAEYGSWSYKIEDTAFGAGGHYAGPRYDGIPATPGTVYSARVRVNVVTNPGAAQLFLDFKDSGGSTLGGRHLSTSFTGTGEADLTLTGLTAPALTDHINVGAVIVNGSGTPAAGLAYFDGFSVLDSATLQDYTDGDQTGSYWAGAQNDSITMTGAPYFSHAGTTGGLSPLKRIRVRRLWDGDYYPVFDGYVEGWPQEFPQFGHDALVSVTASDGFMPLAQFKLPRYPNYNESIALGDPVAYWRMGDTGPPVVHDERGSAAATVPADKNASDFGFPGSIVGDVDGRMRFTRTALDWVSLPTVPDMWSFATFEAWWEPLDTSDSNIISMFNGGTFPIALYMSGQKAKFTVDPDALSAVSATGTTTLAVGTAYHIVGVWTGGAVLVYVNGVLEDSQVIGAGGISGVLTGDIAGPTTGGITLSNGYIDEAAIYASALGSGEVLAHYNSGQAGIDAESSGDRIGRLLNLTGTWSADTQVDAGIMDVEGIRFSGQTIRSEIEAAEISEDGTFFVDREGQETFLERDWQAGKSLVATFGNTPGSLDFRDPVISYDLSFLINSFNLSWPASGGVDSSYTDATSVSRYFERTRNVDTLLTNQTDVDDLGARLLDTHKNPMLRVTEFSVTPLKSDAITEAVLNIELRDLIGVEVQPMEGESVIEQESYVERIVDTETPEDWTVQYGISPR